MSASREKKMRKLTGDSAAKVTEAPKKSNKTIKKVLAIAVSVILVLAIVFFCLINFGFFNNHGTAAVVSGHKLTPAMVNYFYRTTISNMSEMLSYLGVDSSKSLSSQAYMNDQFDTWADYLLDQALAGASEIYALYDAAIADGYQLSDEDKAQIDSNIATYEMYAPYYGYESVDQMIAAEYGKGCNEENFREYMTVSLIASNYANDYNNSLSYSADQLSQYYQEHTEEFDAVTYRMYNVAVSEGTENVAKAMEELEVIAEDIATSSVGSELIFIEKVNEYATEEDAFSMTTEDSTLRENNTKKNVDELFVDWLFDNERKEGDTTYIRNGDAGYYVLYFKSFTDNNYQLPNVRHILISSQDVNDEEARAAAKEQAEQLLSDFLAGEATEEAFAALATEKSADSAEGGLYENILHGKMVATFEDWCYDEARQIGDTGIVESDYGYHVMYFSGYGETYLDYTVRETMRSNDYNVWYDGIIANVSYKSYSFMMKFASIT